jgi:tetratricopeptide (TPR) repeat protein
MYGKMEKQNKEIDAYHQYIQRDASNPDSCEKIGVILADKGLVNDAMVFLEMANALKPDQPDFIFRLGAEYAGTDRLTDALPLLEKAKNLKPNDEKVHSLYNDVRQRMEKMRKAGSDAKKIVR